MLRSPFSSNTVIHARYCVVYLIQGFIGRKLCPQLVFVKSDFDAYRKAAGAVGAAVELSPSGGRCGATVELLSSLVVLSLRHSL